MELRSQTLDAAGRNIARLRSEIERVKSVDAERLRREYQRLVQGLESQGALRQGNAGADQWLANPALPADIVREAVPGNIRRAGACVWEGGRGSGGPPK